MGVWVTALLGLMLLMSARVSAATDDASDVTADETTLGNALSGRGPGRTKLAARYGGNAASEAAVAKALKWLAEHQFADGGWNFNHGSAPKCQGKCPSPGALGDEARIAATAMALLPFLGAGQTHKQGQYKSEVKAGLQYLVFRMKPSANGGSLYEQGGRMYSHGLASIALCEAYAMTRDRGLQDPAQKALDFIVYAQDPVGGGWRYMPRQKGDTSVFGWQLAALKTGHLAYLRVPADTVTKAYTFLDTVTADQGVHYGYATPGTGQATTAIGLLSRMYLGWRHDDRRLDSGVDWLADQGPSKGNMYYNYYATQVVFQYDAPHEGKLWKEWNATIRDNLVSEQATDGHAAGSWYFPKGDHGADRGGRLYCTSLSALTLEVYYRYLPIYRQQRVRDEALPRK